MKNKITKILVINIIFFNLILGNSISAFAAGLSDITYSYSPKIIHITNDYNLKNYLSSVSKGSLNVADYAKSHYFLEYKKSIDITKVSIAIEILGHVYPDKIARYIPFGLGKVITKHTSIIDIGEKSVDSNRWIWDSIAAVIGSSFSVNSSNIRSLNIYTIPQNTTEQHVDQIIKDLKNKDLRLNRDIMIKVQKDIDNGTIDPMLLKMMEK
ncbi:hypothetical protein [Clostridium oceanicum]|uniref:Uncharacterized protein n=1 Tax=Clostridium oceanicum TaxID=1543 RepID=A0ABP3V5T1_9CLOT